ncbi:MAG: ZIP family metal transporter [Clostridiales bacterium]|nr:ZIP family metal transporter [Clostridiales bacterium]
MSISQIYYTAAGFFAGVLGTGLGSLFAVFFDRHGSRFLSAVLEFTAGLMLAVSLLDLLPAAFEHASLFIVLISVSFGVFVIFLVDGHSGHTVNPKNRMFTTGISIAISIALHNFPEGLAIGSAFGSSTRLGLTLFLAILLHDIPEGVALSVPLKCGGISGKRIVLIAALSGVPTGIGAFLGAIAGQISLLFVSICLSFAAGAMLYVVLIDLLPESQRLSDDRFSTFFSILGVLLGVIISSGLG